MRDSSERSPFTKSPAEVAADIIEDARNGKYASEYLAMLS